MLRKLFRCQNVIGGGKTSGRHERYIFQVELIIPAIVMHDSIHCADHYYCRNEVHDITDYMHNHFRIFQLY